MTFPAIEPLDRRIFLAGGIDQSYTAQIGGLDYLEYATQDLVVDPAGRLLRAGMIEGRTPGDSPMPDGMLLKRVNRDGTLDTSFGIGGANTGAPRGLTGILDVVPLARGGYLAHGVRSDWEHLIVRFTDSGFIDPTFGKNGVTRLPFVPRRMLEGADGSLLVLGQGFVAKLRANGRLDGNFGIDGVVAFSGTSTHTENGILYTTSEDVIDARLDAAGRLVLSARRAVYVNVVDGVAARTVPVVIRLLTDGSADDSFGSDPFAPGRAVLRGYPAQGASAGNPATAFALPRSDGLISVVVEPGGSGPSEVRLMDTSGDLLTAANGRLRLHDSSPRFATRPLERGQVLQLEDNSLVIGGGVAGMNAKSAAVVRVAPDNAIDTNWASDGVLRLDQEFGRSAQFLNANPDGSLLASSGAGIQRIFRDDRPVLSVESIRRKNDQYRIAVTIRGTGRIDASTLGDDELRLIDGAGNRLKLRFMGSVINADGSVNATYRINRSFVFAGDWSIRTITGKILDDDGNRLLGRRVGGLLA